MDLEDVLFVDLLKKIAAVLFKIIKIPELLTAIVVKISKLCISLAIHIYQCWLSEIIDGFPNLKNLCAVSQWLTEVEKKH